MNIKSITAISLISIGALSIGWTMAQDNEKETTAIETKVSTTIQSPLTQDRINAYYKEADKVQTQEMEALKSWLQDHIHEDADIEMNVNLNIEEYDVKDRVQESFLDKYLLIQDNVDSYKVAKTEMVETTIESFTLSEDGKIATVKLINKSRAKSFGDEAKNKSPLLITSKGKCTDELTMTDSIIQLLKRSCKLNTEAFATKP